MRFINLAASFEKLRGLPHEERLEALLRAVGCAFHEPGLIRTPVVGVIGIGGLPVTGEDPLEIAGMPTSVERLREGFASMRGLGGCLTYLNPRDRTPQDMAGVLAGSGHASTAHACSVNVGVFGLTSAVEHEFDTQRDLLHLARLTVARTAAQDAPPLVVRDERLLEASAATRQILTQALSAFPRTTRDAHEAANMLWPKSSATAIVLSGTLRNFARLVAQKDDEGKEAEYRELTAAIGAALRPLMPDLFPI